MTSNGWSCHGLLSGQYRGLYEIGNSTEGKLAIPKDNTRAKCVRRDPKLAPWSTVTNQLFCKCIFQSRIPSQNLCLPQS